MSARSIRVLRAFAWGGLALTLVACGASKPITRDFGGRYEQGREIPGDAYAAALRGAIAEAGGDFRLARKEYARASALFPDDPELSTRTAFAACALKPDAMDLEDVTRAHATYAPAWLALARCYDRMDRAAAAASARKTAAELAPGTPGLSLDAFVEATFLRDNAASYFSVATQAAARDDAPLELWSYLRVAELAPSRRADVIQAAGALLLAGRVVDARTLASRLADLGLQRDGSVRLPPNLGRLAADDALLRDDTSLAMARANAARITLGELALRAQVLGRRTPAKALVDLVLATDPESGDAKLAAMLLREGEVPLGAETPSVLTLSRFGRVVLAASVLPWSSEIAARILGERKADVSDVEDPLTRRLLVHLAMSEGVRSDQTMLDTFVEAKLRAGKNTPEGLLHSPVLERVRNVLRGSKATFRTSEALQDPLAGYGWCKLHGKDDLTFLRQVVNAHPADALVLSCAIEAGLSDTTLKARAASLQTRGAQ